MKKPWFNTYTGVKFYITEPRACDITLVDIAHALCLFNRFGGHTRVPYSIGRHSLYVKKMLELMDPKNYLLHMHGLMHDASEYVLGDVVRPLKYSMPNYLALEERTQKLILQRFKIPKLNTVEEKDLKIADNRLLMGERKALITQAKHKWSIKEEPAPFKITPGNWRKNESRFLSEFYSLLPLI